MLAEKSNYLNFPGYIHKKYPVLCIAMYLSQCRQNNNESDENTDLIEFLMEVRISFLIPIPNFLL